MFVNALVTDNGEAVPTPKEMMEKCEEISAHVHTHPGHRDPENNPGYGKGIPSVADYKQARGHCANVHHFIVPREGNPTYYIPIDWYGNVVKQYYPATLKNIERFHKMFPSIKK